MASAGDDLFPIRSGNDVVRARQAVREAAQNLGFSLVDQTKIVTAASELARNTLDHGGGGVMRLEIVGGPDNGGVRLTFTDEGPGIQDVSLALRDGYTTGSGLGLGLGGAKRLVSEFSIDSEPGRGTEIVVTRWKR